jgi:secondary thiamine-phosphate synthase enzyme
MIYLKEITLATAGFCDIIDITPAAEEALRSSGVTDGLLTVSVPGSTAGISTIEYEPGLVEDLKTLFERLIPVQGAYSHDQAWHDGNGFSHLRATLLGPSRSFPVQNGKALLGTWQQIILIDFDNRPRQRTVLLHVMGEKDMKAGKGKEKKRK